MATSKSTQLVQYGAVVAGAAAIPAIAKGISAFNPGGGMAPVYDPGGVLVSPGVEGVSMSAAADAATKTFADSFTKTVTSAGFLTSVGLGLAGIALGSGSLRPSLTLPKLAATAAVGLSVAQLLKQGKAAASSGAAGGTGIKQTRAIGIVDSTAPAVGTDTASARDAGSTASYVYPLNSTNSTYWMRFSMSPYKRGTGAEKYALTPGNAQTFIRLPLPAQLIDAMKLQYQEISLGVFGGPVLEDIGKALDKYQETTAFGGNAASGVRAFVASGKASMMKRLEDENFLYSAGRRMLQASGSLGAAADMLSTTAPNPHMAVTYQGVNLKKHSFSWRFSPDNIEESKQIQYIIKEFQKSALPTADGAFLLNFPDIVNIEMSPSNLMTFQPCSIDSVLVNYAPNGVPSFFAPDPKLGNAAGNERYPTEIELTLVLRELDIHTGDMAFYKNIGNVTAVPPAEAKPEAAN